jgi:glycerol-3-phosphate acyltransferase PlsY
MNDLVLAFVAGYLIGAIPFGYLAGRLRGVDLRKAGSGNTGGTNAVRVLGARYGVPVIALDIAKGAVAVVVGDSLGGTNGAVVAATAAVIGHAFPVFLGFRGGKAVATGAGAMMALVPWIGVTVFFTWIALVVITRYVSVASIAAALCYWALCVISGQPWAVTAFTVFGAGLVIWRHRANIVRLRNGTEPRFNRGAIRRSRPSGPPTTGPPGSG